MSALYLIPVAWVMGWLIWFVRQDRDYTSEVLFGLTFGLVAWPLIGLAQVRRRTSLGLPQSNDAAGVIDSPTQPR